MVLQFPTPSPPCDFNVSLSLPLKEVDPEVQNIIDKETWRQFSGIELIASENCTSLAAMQVNGSILMNKVSEGRPGARNQGGNAHIDELEGLCQARACSAFGLDPGLWGVNVQPYSGTTANFAALTALANLQDRIMGLGIQDGGHFSHGYYTAKKRMTATAANFQWLHYSVNLQTHRVDYDNLATLAHHFKPHVITCGASAYPRDWDYKRLRSIADDHHAFLLADIAHISGLIAAGAGLEDPFPWCDIVTTTTHKTLRGPRAGLVFYRKSLESRVNDAVFPGCQGGPHNNTIAGIAVTLHLASTPSFKAYAKQVILNARVLASELLSYGYTLRTGGTDTHLILCDLRPLNMTGDKVEKVCDLVGITISKYALVGDQSPQQPGGIRLGTSALTSRSLLDSDMKRVASLLHRAIRLALAIDKTKLVEDFNFAAAQGIGSVANEIAKLREEVGEFARSWPLPGVDIQKLRGGDKTW